MTDGAMQEDVFLDEIIVYIQSKDANLSVMVMPRTFRDDPRIISIRKMHGGEMFGADWAISQEDLQQIACKEALFQVADAYVDLIKKAVRREN